MKHTSNVICEVLDPEGNLFKVKYKERNESLYFVLSIYLFTHFVNGELCSPVVLILWVGSLANQMSQQPGTGYGIEWTSVWK